MVWHVFINNKNETYTLLKCMSRLLAPRISLGAILMEWKNCVNLFILLKDYEPQMNDILFYKYFSQFYDSQMQKQKFRRIQSKFIANIANVFLT